MLKLIFIFVSYIAEKQDGCEAAFKFFSCGIKLNPLTVSQNKNIYLKYNSIKL